MQAIFKGEIIDVEILNTKPTPIGTRYNVNGKFSNGLAIKHVTNYGKNVIVLGRYPNGRIITNGIRITNVN